jgi:hypothetical protein
MEVKYCPLQSPEKPFLVVFSDGRRKWYDRDECYVLGLDNEGSEAILDYFGVERNHNE